MNEVQSDGGVRDQQEILATVHEIGRDVLKTRIMAGIALVLAFAASVVEVVRCLV